MIASERALAFFDEARAAFRGDRIADYRIAGETVRIRSEEGFDFVHRAFAHLQTGDGAPDLDISIGRSPAMPSPPWSVADYGARGEIRGFNDVRFRTAFDHIGSSLSMLDLERHQAIFWTRDADTLPQSEHGAPLKTILHWWLDQRGDLLLHAAAIGNEKHAVLLPGAGGAGKSTTAILCARDGLTYLGDDYCAVELSERRRVHSLYATGKLAHAHSADTKELLYLNEEATVNVTAHLPLRAILVPEIDASASNTKIEPAGSGAAFKALAPSTISQLSGAGPQTFQRIARLAQSLPAFRISLARDFDRIPDVVRKFLSA